MLNRLRIKFVCINMTIVMLLLGLFFLILYQATSANLKQDSIQMMQAISANPMHLRRPDELAKDVRLPYFCVQTSHNGELMSLGGGYFDLTDSASLGQIVEATLSRPEQIGELEEYNLRFCKSSTPLGQCIVFADMTMEQSTLRSLVKNSALIGLAAFAIFLVVSILLADWAVRPIEIAWKQQKQFIADASHELKTPLTVIITNAELLNAPECPGEDRRTLLDNILTVSGQMRGLVESLLKLARIDAGRVAAAVEPFSLSEVVCDAILPFEPVFFERGLEIRSDITPDIRVKGNREQLKQLVEVLLDNARKYSDPGPTVVTLRRQSRRSCILSVSNPGTPLTAGERKEIFKRFYRGDQVRAMNHSYGLGLSIAQSIVEEHHGKIWAESSGGDNTFLAELPVLS